MRGKEEMVDLEELRYLALSFPDTTEEEHHDRPAFRVGGKIFATLPDDEHINVLLDAEAAHIATVITPAGCEKLWWGERLAGITVCLADAELDMLAAALTAAWRRKAPRDLAGTID
ncbi:MmcQ/YjbR family DNA-binding protein [Janthinobacterium sp. GW458P]|uniref:MmcQ/YjbR family DNA-binding protein n=2 Tax=Janthinobacterium sp. GW458P TaxID=1981504 RepID=UPI001D01764B|nr:MmcQ/YjbR family DNA-binding protein [Janthinobacterium sp. GW458P]